MTEPVDTGTRCGRELREGNSLSYVVFLEALVHGTIGDRSTWYVAASISDAERGYVAGIETLRRLAR